MSGTLAESISSVTLLARAISHAWPSSAKPVTSVAACAPASDIARAASRPASSIVESEARITSSLALPNLMPVETTPVPTGFVRRSASPGRAPRLVTTRRGSMVPVTA